MRTRLTIESDQPIMVLVIPLPQRVERRAPRCVIVTTGYSRDSELPPSGPAASVQPFPPLRRAG